MALQLMRRNRQAPIPTASRHVNVFVVRMRVVVPPYVVFYYQQHDPNPVDPLSSPAAAKDGQEARRSSEKSKTETANSDRKGTKHCLELEAQGALGQAG